MKKEILKSLKRLREKHPDALLSCSVVATFTPCSEKTRTSPILSLVWT